MGGAWLGWRAVGVAVGVGVGAVLAWRAWRRRLTHPDRFTRWEEVGEVGQLVIYPLKSGRGVKVIEAEATRYGLAHDLLEDRSFGALHDNSLMRGKHDPKLFTVTLTLEGSEVTMQAKGEGKEQALQFDLQDVVRTGEVTEVTAYGIKGYGYDCGEEAAAWLTRVLQVKGETRLVYNGDLTRERESSEDCRGIKINDELKYFYNNFRSSDRVVYQEHAPYLLTSEASLADLNSRMQKPVTQDWFRPSIVVTGVKKAYDEDDWAFIRIGNVVFRRIKPCDRYVYVDPEAGKKAWHGTGDKMMKALAESHKMEGPANLQNHWERWPAFGSLLGIDECGLLRVGDKVEVARASCNPHWHLLKRD